MTNYISLMRRGILHEILVRDICYFQHSQGSELWTITDMYCCEESLCPMGTASADEHFSDAIVNIW